MSAYPAPCFFGLIVKMQSLIHSIDHSSQKVLCSFLTDIVSIFSFLTIIYGDFKIFLGPGVTLNVPFLKF